MPRKKKDDDAELLAELLGLGQKVFGLAITNVGGLLVSSTSYPPSFPPDRLADILARAVDTCLELAASHDEKNGTDVLPQLNRLLRQPRKIEPLGSATVPGFPGAPDPLADTARIGPDGLDRLPRRKRRAAENPRKKPARKKNKKSEHADPPP